MTMNYFRGFLLFLCIVLTLTYDDLSVNKVATQSTTVLPPPNDPNKYVAGNAVDRDIMTCMRTYEIGPNSPDKTVWWKVDLGRVYNIYSVNILFKNYDGHEMRQQGRFAGFSLYVSNVRDIDGSFLCYMDGPDLPLLNFSTTCITSGRYVIFYNERLGGVAYPAGYEVSGSVSMELCEVVVNGCNRAGVYGINCDIPCPNNCKYNTCHIENGDCFGCKPGWTGTVCNKGCVGGWYGVNCTQQCVGHCLNDVYCDHETGQCDGHCAYGWYGQHCNETCNGHCLNNAICNQVTGLCDGGCAYGWYGQYCNETCIGHCINNATCNQETGLCDGGCDAGWRGYKCDEACKDGTFGHGCISNCSGQCVDDSPCNKHNGHCDRGCKPGYTDVFCNKSCVDSYGENCRNPCSKHCINGDCDRFNGSCVSGCVDGFIGDRCNQVNQSVEVFSRSADCKQEDTCCVGLSVSLGFNVLSIIIITILIWNQYRKTHPGESCPCWKSPIYEKSTAPVGQESTYQELNIIENQYQSINPN